MAIRHDPLNRLLMSASIFVTNEKAQKMKTGNFGFTTGLGADNYFTSAHNQLLASRTDVGCIATPTAVTHNVTL